MSDFFASMAGRSRGEGEILRPLHALYRPDESAHAVEIQEEGATPSPFDGARTRRAMPQPSASLETPLAGAPSINDPNQHDSRVVKQTGGDSTTTATEQVEALDGSIVPASIQRAPNSHLEALPSRAVASIEAERLLASETSHPAAPPEQALPRTRTTRQNATRPAIGPKMDAAPRENAAITLGRSDSWAAAVPAVESSVPVEPAPSLGEPAPGVIDVDATLRLNQAPTLSAAVLAVAQPAVGMAVSEPPSRSVTVSIGRLEVKVVAPAPGAKPAAAPPAGDGLKDYLRRRGGGAR